MKLKIGEGGMGEVDTQNFEYMSEVDTQNFEYMREVLKNYGVNIEVVVGSNKIKKIMCIYTKLWAYGTYEVYVHPTYSHYVLIFGGIGITICTTDKGVRVHQLSHVAVGFTTKCDDCLIEFFDGRIAIISGPRTQARGIEFGFEIRNVGECIYVRGNC